MVSFIQQLNDSPWSTALRESLYLYSYLNTLHVVAIMLFVGTIWMFDLRLIRVAFKQTPIATMCARLLPLAIGGFALMALTGALLFFANPARMYHNFWFRLKLVLLMVGAVNALVFHWRAKREGRLAGYVSLFVWLLVIVVGRMSAYHWFDCDRSPPDWISWLAQCEAGS